MDVPDLENIKMMCIYDYFGTIPSHEPNQLIKTYFPIAVLIYFAYKLLNYLQLLAAWPTETGIILKPEVQIPSDSSQMFS